MIEAKTWDMTICRSDGGMPRSALQLTVRLGGQLPIRTRHSSLDSTNHDFRDLGLDHVIMFGYCQ